MVVVLGGWQPLVKGSFYQLFGFYHQSIFLSVAVKDS